MEDMATNGRILHICPNFPFTKLYDLLFSRLSKQQRNIVYAPVSQKDMNTIYPVVWGRDFGAVDRLLFFRKQFIIKNDIKSKGLCDSCSLIHAHNLFSAGYTARNLSKEYGIPYIVAVRNTDVNDFFHYMVHLRPLGIKVMRDAAAVVFLSPSYKDFVLEKYVPTKYKNIILEKSCVIPNGIDDFFLDNRITETKSLLPNNQLRLIYVGEVNSNKNVTTTLKACEQLESLGYQPNLTIVGRISDSQYEWVKNNKYVNYYPQTPKEVVLKHLRENDIFVMPSLKETFGLVYVEALSQGLPIIYSKGQGVDGYFEEGLVGYHVDSTKSEEIVQAVENIIQRYSEISKNCINTAKPFSWDNIAGIYMNLYGKVLKK